MTEQPAPDAAASDASSSEAAATAVLPPAFTPQQIDNFLTLDQIMSSARRSRRTAQICLRADLEAEYLELHEQLGQLVTVDGELLAEDASMTDAEEVSTLRDQIAALHAEMTANTRPMLFEAMDDDTWQAFEKKHRGVDGKIKDTVAWQNELIAACAINPTMTVEQVVATRGKLGPTQITAMANAAYSACSSGGVDVPKLPSFWHSPKPQESSQS